MPCLVEPTPEERTAADESHRRILQKAIAYDEINQNWLVFQQELCEFLTATLGDLGELSQNRAYVGRYPNLLDWMAQHAAADRERLQRKAVLEEIAAKLSELDDATLFQIGFKRV